MKKLLILIPLLLSSGCIYQITDITDITKSEQFCKDKGGIKYIRVGFAGSEVVICTNDESEILKNITMIIEND